MSLVTALAGTVPGTVIVRLLSEKTNHFVGGSDRHHISLGPCDESACHNGTLFYR